MRLFLFFYFLWVGTGIQVRFNFPIRTKTGEIPIWCSYIKYGRLRPNIKLLLLLDLSEWEFQGSNKYQYLVCWYKFIMLKYLFQGDTGNLLVFMIIGLTHLILVLMHMRNRLLLMPLQTYLASLIVWSLVWDFSTTLSIREANALARMRWHTGWSQHLSLANAISTKIWCVVLYTIQTV